ncbi:MAG: molybdopterin-dependent oxidoreductase, partial [Candidatus Omnitrophica bacterium]|nr:molybdopterin-dependent oxidoreductase [Candidatus Omnitrophota bacterium]
IGYDHYSTNLKLEECLDDDVLLVHSWEGKPLAKEHGGPVRMITPRKYAWKGSKWIKEIQFLSVERLGFWEERGYSTSADPWFNDRYS